MDKRGPNTLPDSALVLQREYGPNVVTGDDPDDELQGILERWQVHQTFWTSIHHDAQDDDKFIAGDHWPEPLRQERADERRPVLTYNLFPSFCRQITNAVRQQRPQLKVTPVETNRGADPRMANVSGTKDYTLADVYSGIIRNIEHVSRADQAYDTALKHAVDHGFGFFYLMNEWSSVDPFVQELVIHRVRNSYSVTLDPDSVEADYRDAQDAFMFTNMRRSTFERKYPDANPDDFAGPTAGTAYEGWWDQDNIRVAQYFNIEYIPDEVLMMSNGKTFYYSQVKEVLDELEYNTGVHIVNDARGKPMRKKFQRPVCMWRKMTARDTLEGPVPLPFSSVPIFPVFGEEMLVDGITRYESAIRHAKDAARSYNYWRTAAAETVALQPRAPYMLTPRQLEGHEDMYEDANTRNQPYLLYNHVDGVPQPGRIQPPSTAAAELQNATQDGQDMQSIIGLHDADLGKASNEKSGKAIIARQNQGQTSTFQFPDNLGRAIEQMGRCIVEAVPQLYDTQRILRIRFPDGTEDFVEINQTVIDEESGQTFLMSDVAYGKYDVVLETGPSYATQRQEAADLQMELLKTLPPEMSANIVHLIVKNLGVPGSDEVSAVLRKMLPDQLKSEDEKLADLPKGVTKNAETGELEKDGKPWQPEPTPDQVLAQKAQQLEEAKNQALMAKAQAEQATAEADKIQAQAKIKMAEADLANAQAEHDKAQAGAGDQAQQQAGMMAEIESIIRDAMQQHQVDPRAHHETTSEMITAAVVDALTRVKGFVDRKVRQGVIEANATMKEHHKGAMADMAEDDEAAESAEEDRETARASAPAKPAAAGAPTINVTVNDRKPARVNFEYDKDGNITGGVPEYETETEED
jgi:hypothetical protein